MEHGQVADDGQQRDDHDVEARRTSAQRAHDAHDRGDEDGRAISVSAV